MGFIDIFRKARLPAGINQSEFSCSRDSLTIGGTEYRPEGETLPVAIVCHGFMANQGTVSHYAIALAEIGYAAYTFDFNGGSVMRSKSSGKTTDMSVLTETKDLESVIEYVSALPYTDSGNILLMGCSQGGFVAALVAAAARYPVKKLSLFYPALCIPDDARSGKMMMARFDPQHVPEFLRCGPMKLGRRYVEDMLPIDPFEAIGGYTGDVLIIHGTEDRIVSPDYSKKAADIYRQSASSVRFDMIEGGRHMFSKKHDIIALETLRTFAVIDN